MWLKKTYQLTSKAQQDRENIWSFINSNSNATRADSVDKELVDAFEMLSSNPNLGHMRNDLTEKSVRFWPVSRYMVIYKPDTSPLEIIRILSSSRDIPSLL